MAVSSGISTQKNGPSRFYLMAWGLIAMLAVAYLVTLIARPDWVEKSFGLPFVKQESNEGTRSLSKALAELKTLKRRVLKLSAENATLKSPPRPVSASRPVSATRATEKSVASVTPVTQGDAVGPETEASVQPALQQPQVQPQEHPAAGVRAARALAARFSNEAQQASAAAKSQADVKTQAALAGVKLINGKTTASALRGTSVARRSSPASAGLVARTGEGKGKGKGKGARPGIKLRKLTARTDGSRNKSKTFAAAQKLQLPPVSGYGRAGGGVKTPAGEGGRRVASNKRVASRRTALRWAARSRRTAARKAAVPITTGSIGPPAPLPVISFGAPVVRRARKATANKSSTSAIALASGSSIADLRLNWLALHDRFGAELGSLQPHYVVYGKGGSRRYRLVAGPLRSGAEALHICSQLKARNIVCSVSTLRGRKL